MARVWIAVMLAACSTTVSIRRAHEDEYPTRQGLDLPHCELAGALAPELRASIEAFARANLVRDVEGLSYRDLPIESGNESCKSGDGWFTDIQITPRTITGERRFASACNSRSIVHTSVSPSIVVAVWIITRHPSSVDNPFYHCVFRHSRLHARRENATSTCFSRSMIESSRRSKSTASQLRLTSWRQSAPLVVENSVLPARSVWTTSSAATTSASPCSRVVFSRWSGTSSATPRRTALLRARERIDLDEIVLGEPRAADDDMRAVLQRDQNVRFRSFRGPAGRTRETDPHHQYEYPSLRNSSRPSPGIRATVVLVGTMKRS